MSHTYSCALFEYFQDIQDPRIDRRKLHPLHEMIAITICAVICGADTWVDVEHFGIEKHAWLKRFLQLNHGIPSHDTFGRVFARIPPEQFQSCFITWIQAVSTRTAGEVIAFDGKTLRGSAAPIDDGAAIHIVSAWASANRLVLGQQKIDEKSNEIIALPLLLEKLEVAGCIITIDAMGCQKKITTQIIQQDAQYVIALKSNQERMHIDAQQLFKQVNNATSLPPSMRFHETYDTDHGREEVRRYWITDCLDTIRDRAAWDGLQSIGMVERTRTMQGITSIEQSYYILSFAPDAFVFANAVRTHWGIENQVHWVLDVAFGEDDSRIRTNHAPTNMAVVRHIALNMLRLDKKQKGSVASKRLRAGWNDAYLANVLQLVEHPTGD